MTPSDSILRGIAAVAQATVFACVVFPFLVGVLSFGAALDAIDYMTLEEKTQ